MFKNDRQNISCSGTETGLALLFSKISPIPSLTECDWNLFRDSSERSPIHEDMTDRDKTRNRRNIV